MAQPYETSQGPGLTIIGKLFVFLFFAACVGGAVYWFGFANKPAGPSGQSPTNGGGAQSNGPGPAPATGGTPPAAGGPAVTVGIAYGTEKRAWLTWAAEQFKATEAGKRVEIELIPMGSIDGANAVLKGDEKAKKIHVWSPASAIYRATLADEWKLKNGGSDPIARSEFLAFSPMVWVMWEPRYNAFVAKYKEISFRTIAQALADSNGSWQAIRGLNDEQQKQTAPWGFLKYGHTNPAESNSGLMTLILQAYDYAGKTQGLSPADTASPEYLKWVKPLQRSAIASVSSTGNLMREMVQRGPSSYDVLFVYESTVIEMIPSAEGRWDKLRVVYPDRNLWNDNPYYVLDVPWSDKEHRKGAEVFLDYLLSEAVQRRALELGFRPANVSVAVKGPESPFTRFESYGLKIDLPTMCEAPDQRVINELLVGWQRK